MEGKKMEVGAANATNNIVVRFWSAHHYEHKHDNQHNMYNGVIQNVRTSKQTFFRNPATFLTILEKFYKEEEKWRKENGNN